MSNETIAAVNATKIDGIKEDIGEVKVMLTQTNDKLDKLRLSHAKMLGAIGSSGVLGGLAGALGTKYIPVAAPTGAVHSGTADILFIILGPVIALLGIGLYKKIMGDRQADLPLVTIEDNSEFRQTQLAEKDEARDEQLSEDMAKPPTDLLTLLAEAEDMIDARRD